MPLGAMNHEKKNPHRHLGVSGPNDRWRLARALLITGEKGKRDLRRQEPTNRFPKTTNQYGVSDDVTPPP